MAERKKLITGILLLAVGLAVAIGGSYAVHMAESPRFDELGRPLYENFPRGWMFVTLVQTVALGGVFVAMAGVMFAWIYDRPLTWSRAMLGALLFTGLMFLIFGIIPNQFLVLTQGALEWTDQKIFLTIPPILVLNNDVSISFAALKDMIAAGYATTLLILVPVVMYKLQRRTPKTEKPEKPMPVSDYGRPLKVKS